MFRAAKRKAPERHAGSSTKIPSIGRVAHTSSPSFFFSEERAWEDSTSIIPRGVIRGVLHPCGFCKGGAFGSSSDAQTTERYYGQKHLYFAERASQGTPDQIPAKFALDNCC